MVRLLGILFLCNILIACRDQQIMLQQHYRSGTLPLKVDGFYWVKVSDTNYNIWKDTFFLYENGVLVYGGGIYDLCENSASFLQFIKRNSDRVFKQKNKSSWGGYIIIGRNIQFEKWEPSSGGPMKTVVRRGHILNDTTFVISEKFNHYDGRTYPVQDTFRFREFSPKPDSTNRFIK